MEKQLEKCRVKCGGSVRRGGEEGEKQASLCSALESVPKAQLVGHCEIIEVEILIAASRANHFIHKANDSVVIHLKPA